MRLAATHAHMHIQIIIITHNNYYVIYVYTFIIRLIELYVLRARVHYTGARVFPPFFVSPKSVLFGKLPCISAFIPTLSLSCCM